MEDYFIQYFKTLLAPYRYLVCTADLRQWKERRQLTAAATEHYSKRDTVEGRRMSSVLFWTRDTVKCDRYCSPPTHRITLGNGCTVAQYVVPSTTENFIQELPFISLSRVKSSVHRTVRGEW